MTDKTEEVCKEMIKTKGFGWRISLSIIVGVGWLIFLILWLFFYASGFNIYQNIAIFIVSILIVGGVLGAAVGVLLGPGVLVAGTAGALIGGLAAKLRDSGFSDASLNAVGESLQPGTSAIVAVIEHTWVAELEKAMAEAEADVLTMAIAADVAEQLDAGREVAYTALSSTDAFAAGRMAAGEEDAEVRIL